MEICHGCLSPLSPQPQAGGVVAARNSVTVSLINSTVTDCKAGQVR